MRSQIQIIVGIAVIGSGLLFLLGSMLGLSPWACLCPGALIAAGVALILRTLLIEPEANFQAKVIGDVKLWEVAPSTSNELWVGVGDIDLDLSRADLPSGEVRYRILGFVGDVDVWLPPDVGLSVTSSAVITDAKILGEHRTNILGPLTFITKGYDAAEHRIRLETVLFVNDLKVREGRRTG